jgi:hypothetical protein
MKNLYFILILFLLISCGEKKSTPIDFDLKSEETFFLIDNDNSVGANDGRLSLMRLDSFKLNRNIYQVMQNLELMNSGDEIWAIEESFFETIGVQIFDDKTFEEKESLSIERARNYHIFNGILYSITDDQINRYDTKDKSVLPSFPLDSIFVFSKFDEDKLVLNLQDKSELLTIDLLTGNTESKVKFEEQIQTFEVAEGMVAVNLGETSDFHIFISSIDNLNNFQELIIDPAITLGIWSQSSKFMDFIDGHFILNTDKKIYITNDFSQINASDQLDPNGIETYRLLTNSLTKQIYKIVNFDVQVFDLDKNLIQSFQMNDDVEFDAIFTLD